LTQGNSLVQSDNSANAESVYVPSTVVTRLGSFPVVVAANSPRRRWYGVWRGHSSAGVTAESGFPAACFVVELVFTFAPRVLLAAISSFGFPAMVQIEE
jgi:hypothetical protein